MARLVIPGKAVNRLDKRTGGRLLPEVRNRRIRELRAVGIIAADPATGVTPYEALPEILSNSVGYYRWARSMVGDLTQEQFWLRDPATGQKIACAEFELEQRLAGAIHALCSTIIRFSLDERGLKIDAAKIEMLSTALQVAAEQAGLDEEQQRKLGSALREQLRLVEQEAA